MDDRLKKNVKVVSLSLDPVKKAFSVTYAKNLVTSSEIVLRLKKKKKRWINLMMMMMRIL